MRARPSSFVQHLAELRKRLFFCVLLFGGIFLLSYTQAERLYYLLSLPLRAVFGAYEEGSRRLIFTSLQEVFITYIKVSSWVAVFVTLPIAMSQLYLFIAPGLRYVEKRVLLPLLALFPLLFFLGIFIAYILLLPIIFRFFLGFEIPSAEETLPLQLELKIHDYLSFTLHLMLAVGLIFQLPLLCILSYVTGLVSLKALRKGRRVAIVLSFLIAALFTPPDPLSQIIMAFPIVALYELSLLVIWILKHMANSKQ